MKRITKLIVVLLLTSCLSFAQTARGNETKQTGRGVVTVSGTPLTFANDVGGMTVSFEELITGSPTSSSILIQGCKNGGNCSTLETYTGNTTSIRAPALDKIYDFFLITPTWVGGTSVKIVVNYTATIARNGSGGSGGAVTSVAGKTGVVTLVEADIASLPADLAASEQIANKDTDVTLAANSDIKYPSQKAIKAYVASQLGGGFYQTLKSNGSSLTQRASTDFSTEFTLADNVTKTDLSVNAIAQAKITGLVAALAGKAATTHTHAEADVTSLLVDLAARLQLGGGTMTGAIVFAGGQTFPGTALASHTHAAADIISGVIATNRLGSGTANGTTWLFGDSTYKSTLPCGGLPTFSSDVTNSSCVMTVVRLNGVLLSGLSTGILKITTGTGLPSTAVAGDFPLLNQNTTGSAGSLSAVSTLPNGTLATTQAIGDNTDKVATNKFVLQNGGTATPMTALGDMVDGGVAGAPTRVAGPTTPDNVPQTLVAIPSGGVAQHVNWSLSGVPIHVKGTSTYTVDLTDRASMVETTNNTTSTAVTVPQAGSSGFGSNLPWLHCNIGTVAVTDTPATSNVNGNTSLKLVGFTSGNNPSCAFWWSDNSNYIAALFLPTDLNGRLHPTGFPAVAGDISNTAGTLNFTVTKLNGTLLSGLTTGILKITTGTGIPSTAVAGDFPILNQNTTGSAAKLTTVRQIAGNNFDGSADVTFNNQFIVRTTDVNLSGAFSLGSLGNGILKHSVVSGTSTPSVANAADIDALFTGTGKCYLFKGTTPGTNDGCDTPTGTGIGDFSSNTSTSVVNEIVLFSDTGGKTGKRSTGSGYAKLTSGVMAPVASIPNADLTNSATTVNGQTATLGSTANVNSGAAAHSVAINEGAGAAIAGVGPDATTDMVLANVAGADPIYKSPIELGKRNYIAGGGTAQAQTATPIPAATSLGTGGLFLRYKPVAANTAAAPTLAVSGLTPTTVTKCGTVALVANDLNTSTIAEVIYDGSGFELLNPQAATCADTTGNAATVTNGVTASAAFSSKGFVFGAAADKTSKSTAQCAANTLPHGQGASDPSCSAVVGADMAANTVTATQLAVVQTYRVCDMIFGDTSGSALTNAQLGPQKRMCFVPAASTVLEIDVAGDAGTPNIIVGRNRAGSTTNLLSGALATAASGGIACSKGTAVTGLDGATTCSATLQNTSTNAGDYFEAVSGTAGGTAKLMTVHVIYTVN